MKRGAVYLVSQGAPPVRELDGVEDEAGPQPHPATSAPETGTGHEATVLRPVVVVSRDAINRHSAVVLVCPLVESSSVHRVYPSDVEVRAPEGGLTVDSVVLTGQLRAVARTQIARQLGELSSQVMHEIAQALRITLDLE